MKRRPLSPRFEMLSRIGKKTQDVIERILRPSAAAFDFRAHFCHSAPMETHCFRLQTPGQRPGGSKRFLTTVEAEAEVASARTPAAARGPAPQAYRVRAIRRGVALPGLRASAHQDRRGGEPRGHRRPSGRIARSLYPPRCAKSRRIPEVVVRAKCSVPPFNRPQHADHPYIHGIHWERTWPTTSKLGIAARV